MLKEDITTVQKLTLLKVLKNVEVDLTPVQVQLATIAEQIDLIPTTDLSSVMTRLTTIESKIDNLPSITGGVTSGGATVFAPKVINLQLNEAYSQSAYNINFAYFYGVECDRSCRVRAYTSIENLLQDANRTTDVRPLNNQCVFDILINKNDGLSRANFYLNPVAIFTGEVLYLRLENLSDETLNFSLKYMG
ncbi:hypothetical protein ACE1CA_03035 [Aerosakkonemataceae cyanobacterium BLCC-F167]|uniref:Uncharacterized protein n=1 Tax=Floridaenema evergladense BLCC-F167 TaxID=3153639 RepID=A0ABV4WET3_9CYAN